MLTRYYQKTKNTFQKSNIEFFLKKKKKKKYQHVCKRYKKLIEDEKVS